MTDTPLQSSAEDLIGKIREIPIFEGLPHDDLAWFVAQCEERHFTVGEIVMNEGDAPDFMIVMLAGKMRARAEHGNSDGPVFTASVGDVTGMLPFSRLKKISVTGR